MSNKRLIDEVVAKASIPPEDAEMFLDLLEMAGMTGRDASTSLVSALNTPNGTPYSADGMRAAAVLNNWGGRF